MADQYQYPKIGIRPIIDGRLGGVRESLEETTMNMAKTVAELFTSELKYPDGTPMQCVIADSCIGGVKEATDCARKFQRENVGVSLSVTPCWCYGTETMDMDPAIPKAIWGFNGTERPGAVYLAATLAGHNQKGLPSFGIYGRDVQDITDRTVPADVREKLLSFARAGMAVALMKGRSYLAIGSVSMGIAGSEVSSDFFQSYLGMRNEYVDSTEVLRRIEQGIYDKDEYEKALKWTKENCAEGKDYNEEKIQRSRDQKDQGWEFVVKMTLIIRDLMEGNPKLAEMGYGEEAQGHDALVSGFQGQRQWTDFLPNGDFSEAILNSSFDWNGIRAPYMVATENDSLNGVSMLFNYLLTNTAQIFADVRTYWSPDAVERVTDWKPEGQAANGFIHLINSGSATLDGSGRQKIDGKPVMKPFWEISEAEKQDCLDATTWYPANLGYFRGGGYSSNYLTTGGMPVTMCRINLSKGLGPTLQIAEGWTIDLPDHVHSALDERTDRTWPTTWFVPNLTGSGPFTDVYSVMNSWGANHGAISYGHIGADLMTLASMLRIPVCMHNVSDQKIFRPSAWNAFGMDKEGADYRACSTYGPLY
ncbi:L-fucose isomerase [Marinoscillum furvescens]|uniref:L-fucose isomerase n=1 Tax=Marinoscillum furvescens DSM 4134 TaxID=1122208 RepID=A0A3D9L919_MARFU|nr:L-fucose isomerase [Marinoscillum furvescens]REE01552.1 L-fucose isomerase [Marinoscillum furvescens DSM 4134]